MRSVVVVFPASMCAAMPIFRVLSRSNCAAMVVTLPTGDPVSLGRSRPYLPEVSKCLVGFRHPVGVFTPLHRCSLVVGGVQQLAGQPLRHRPPAAPPRRRNQPPDPKALPPVRTHFYRHLIGRAAHAPPSNFH